jgi:hypothetical protein
MLSVSSCASIVFIGCANLSYFSSPRYSSMPLHNPLGLLGLLSVIPLIIVYLIRPRPKEMLFSSTIFLREGEAERSAVLSRLIKDPLFWVQLLILCCLSIAAAGPYTISLQPSQSHLAIVLDVSASMQASFSQALQTIDPYLAGYQKISIVLAENIPAVALQAGSIEEARDVLAVARPKAVSADLSSAMNLAQGLLGSEDGNVLVVSDFISWTGEKPEAARNLLEADGIGVVFAKVSGRKDNLAIVGGWNVQGLGLVNHTCQVHNFGPTRTVTLTASGPGGSSSRSTTIPQGEDFYLSFSAYPGLNKISLEADDAISWDNQAYLLVPEMRGARALYLGEDAPALAALNALPNLKVERSGDIESYDLVVLGKNASSDGRLNRYIDGGGRAAYLAYTPESPEFLPVKVNGEAEGPANLWVRSQGFAEDIHFQEIGLFGYLDAAARRSSTTLVEANGAPVLSYWRLGRGLVVYDGLEKDSDFYMRPEYPIFWYQMVNWLTGVPKISDSNRKTGEVVPMGESAAVTPPSGTLTTSTLLLDEVGLYQFQGRSVAANMYDPVESDLTAGASYPAGEFKPTRGETAAEEDLSLWLILLAVLALAAELAIMRWRRET